jgi:phospholipase/carboxylesterase
MCHGLYDPVLPHGLGVMARDALRALGYTVEWKEYPMQHQVCLPEIEAIGAWLRIRLGAAAAR